MKKDYSYIVQYDVAAECASPLRTASGEGRDTLLRRSDGLPLVQGSSISGALREWIEQNKGSQTASILFGDRGEFGEGILAVSNGVFDLETAQELSRPHVSIDPETGTNAKGKYFSFSHIATGSKFSFRLTWFGENETEDAEKLQALEAALGAMNQGFLPLGSKKSDGFGKLKLNVRKAVYHMSDAGDRSAWVNQSKEGKPLVLASALPQNTVTFHVVAELPNVLVKAEKREDKVVNLTEGETAIIPGSSIKGTVRSRFSSIEAFLRNGSTEYTENAFGRDAQGNDSGIAGKIYFSDIALDKGHKVEAHRIRINRFTGGVFVGALVTEEPRYSKISFDIIAPSDSVTCYLLTLALRDLGLGLYEIGSGASIGRGKAKKLCLTAKNAKNQGMTLSFDSFGRASLQDADGLFGSWEKEARKEMGR